MCATDILELLKEVLVIIASIAVGLYFLLPFFTTVGFFCTKKFPEAKKKHKYAIMIAARNEAAVIGGLIKSINAQDYPKELITVFVVADNCTDNTAQIARDLGAVCYERNDPDHRTKGYALEFLVDNIKHDYGIEAFEAYFIFDADNLLKKDYISRMNEAFDSGEKIVTSYRNTKNFADNWIAASYGLHWIRTIRHEHRGRSSLGLACRIQGTGFMFASEIIKDGWHYVSFTEDRAFAADAVVAGYRISYCNSAEFYDEQPTSLRIALRQRIRWSKGHLQAFAESGPKLFGHIFVSVKNRPEYPESTPNNLPVTDNTAIHILEDAKKVYGFAKDLRFNSAFNTVLSLAKILLYLPSLLLCAIAYAICAVSFCIGKISAVIKQAPIWHRIANSQSFRGLKMRLMSYDMLTITFPKNLISMLAKVITLFADIAIVCLVGVAMQKWYTPLTAFLLSFSLRYVGNIFLGIYVFFIERRRIVRIPLLKKLYFCLMWPIFDVIGEVTMFAAMFMKVEWKPIPHKVNVDVEDISSSDNT
ncbi:MAG: glycosyltransferase [Ruminococcaceae bacterium]|nr:glycosyltransferase [Oscillospiraceae bacterium]